MSFSSPLIVDSKSTVLSEEKRAFEGCVLSCWQLMGFLKNCSQFTVGVLLSRIRTHKSSPFLLTTSAEPTLLMFKETDIAYSQLRIIMVHNYNFSLQINKPTIIIHSLFYWPDIFPTNNFALPPFYQSRSVTFLLSLKYHSQNVLTSWRYVIFSTLGVLFQNNA